MNQLSYMFWFSGTGNSLYVAKQLSAGLGNLPLVHMGTEAPTNTIGGKGTKIGFIFPSYYGNLPRAVRVFIEKLEIMPDTYLFAIVTMGGVGQGSIAALNKLLAAKNLRLNYGRGIVMPANYVIMYNPADSGKSVKALKKADRRIQKLIGELEANTHSVKSLPVTANRLYKNIEMLDAAFTVNDNCTGCGLCEKICPVQNIRQEKRKPEWLHHCEHCVACISWCPVKAIEYGTHTQSRRRYCNPKIKVNELEVEKRRLPEV